MLRCFYVDSQRYPRQAIRAFKSKSFSCRCRNEWLVENATWHSLYQCLLNFFFLCRHFPFRPRIACSLCPRQFWKWVLKLLCSFRYQHCSPSVTTLSVWPFCFYNKRSMSFFFGLLSLAVESSDCFVLSYISVYLRTRTFPNRYELVTEFINGYTGWFWTFTPVFTKCKTLNAVTIRYKRDFKSYNDFCRGAL